MMPFYKCNLQKFIEKKSVAEDDKDDIAIQLSQAVAKLHSLDIS